ncbi:HNH endonuclease signature motif containing protein [Arthrobacter sp. Alg241-R88]|uniref:HNH endonuclease signature motif containing protein n=1 Tax=Arthrobacter sp. Alg241-R88 TaxID=2305984 RepID=UPI0019673573|nr:HNH endonuclease signature motif containing protein [Arthrobacter sp. Alg241-R88]
MPRKPAEPVADRIKRRVTIDPETGCWLWQGAIATATGYGRMAINNGRFGGERVMTHRMSYETFVGPIPAGMVIDHLCRVRSCCNPDHLEPVTQAENLRRGEGVPSNAFREATHCIHGHEFTPENTYRTDKGRYCRACRRRRNQESAARKKARA